MERLENTNENLLSLIKRGDLISIKAFKAELGFNTERRKLNLLTECMDWLKDSPKNSLQFTFGDLWSDEEIKVVELK